MPPKSLRWAKSKHNRAKLSFSLLFGARPSSSLFGAPSVRDPHPCARFASLRAICILASHLYPCEPSASLCPIRIPAHDLHSLRAMCILALRQLRALSALQSSAGGTTQLSPALQRWVCRQTKPSVP